MENVSWDDVMYQFIAPFAATPAWGAGDRLCLPTEMEWEYAARGGTRTAYWWGDVADEAQANLNVSGNRRSDDAQGTTPVHRYLPNPWGLSDVHGNVWEWCADVWRPRRDTPEVGLDEALRVIRGGSWFTPPDGVRAAYRDGGARRGANKPRGFRFALRSFS